MQKMAIEQRIQGQIQRILNSETLTNQMRTKLSEYHNSLHNAKLTTKLDYLVRLKKLGEHAQRRGVKKFEELTKTEIDLFLSRLKTVGTRNAYISGMKTFYRWLGHEEIVKDFKPKKNRNNNITPSQLLTPEDIVKLTKHMPTEKIRVLVLTLFESAARISEVLDLRVDDIEFQSVRDKENKPSQIAILYFGRSKADIQKQPITMVMFASELNRWTQSHPYKNDGTAYVFFSARKPAQHIDKSVVGRNLKQAAERTGIKKKVNPHWLRHSMLSYLANQRNYNEQLLMWRAGWNSTLMAKRYIHSGAEIERKEYLKRHGFKVEKKEKEIIKPKPCPHCNHLNPYTNNSCDLCGMPLDLKQYQKALKKKRLVEVGFDEIKKQMDRLDDELQGIRIELDLRRKEDIVRFICWKTPTNIALQQFMARRRFPKTLLDELRDRGIVMKKEELGGRWVYVEENDPYGFGSDPTFFPNKAYQAQ